MTFESPEPSKKMFDFWNFLFEEESFDLFHKGPPLWNFGNSDELSFSQRNRITLLGKSVLSFSKLIIEKSQFFSTRSHAYLHGPLGQIGLRKNHKIRWQFKLWLLMVIFTRIRLHPASSNFASTQTELKHHSRSHLYNNVQNLRTNHRMRWQISSSWSSSPELGYIPHHPNLAGTQTENQGKINCGASLEPDFIQNYLLCKHVFEFWWSR